MAQQKNILLQDFDTPFRTPPFSQIKAEDYIPAVKQGIKEAYENIEAIKNNPDKPTFENTIEAMEHVSDTLYRVLYIFYSLLSADGGDDYHALVAEIGPLTADLSSDIMLDDVLFERVKTVYDARETRDYETVEMTLLQDTYDGFVRSGALLGQAEKKRLKEISAESATLSPRFSQNVVKCSGAFELKITDENDLKGLPETAIENAAHEAKERGYDDAWVFTLDAPSFIPFLTFADNRDLREKIWRAYTARAMDGEFDNKPIIARTLELRQESASLLGFDTYADYVLEDRMVKKVETVTDFLDTLYKTYRPAAEADLKQLQDFAQETGDLDQLKPWDVGYYSEKLKEKTFEFSEEELRPYFPLAKVLDGTFAHFQKLFNLDFIENKDIETWHKDVVAYEVRDKDTHDLFGVIYTDFYVRKGKRSGAWKGSLRTHGSFRGEALPSLVTVCCNFAKPTDTKPSLLSHSDVLTIFHERGHALHDLLGRTKYKSTSGTNVLWDFVELPSQLQENWLYESETLNMVSSHFETGAKLPSELIEKLRQSKNFMSGWGGLRYLSHAYMDMAFHTAKTPPKANEVVSFEKQATDKCRLFEDYGGCSATAFGHIFAGGYAAGYYSYKWAAVLDADTFELFQEKGLYDRNTALHYRREILEKGGSEAPEVLYHNFRGRDADPKAVLRREGLLKKAS